ncbi:Uncharacterised protein [Haemophilus haemolyticus]|nr:Uncharacterised protein [Haemophilus haemolyticus]
MLYIITCLFVSLSLILPKNKFLSLVFSSWLILLFSLNNGGADFDGYEAYFELSKDWSINLFKSDSFLFNTGYLAHLLNLDLLEHNFIVYTPIFLLVFVLIYKFSKYPNLVLVLFCIFPYIDFVIQKRNTLAVSFIFIGIYFFIKRFGDRIGILVYLICCYIAHLIHSSSIAYIMFIPVYYIFNIRNSIFKKAFFTVSFIILLFFMLNIDTVMNVFFPGKVQAYILNEEGRISFLKVSIFILIHLMYLFIQKLSYDLYKEKYSSNEINEKEFFMIKVFYSISLMSIYFIPLYFINITFFRIFRNLFLLIFISSTNILLFNYRRLSLSKLLFLILLFIIQIGMFLFSYVLTGDNSFYKLVHPIFTDNILLFN